MNAIDANRSPKQTKKKIKEITATTTNAVVNIYRNVESEKIEDRQRRENFSSLQ